MKPILTDRAYVAAFAFLPFHWPYLRLNLRGLG